MTPKEKAEELVKSFLTASFGTIEEYVPIPYVFAKQCALIAVDEILKNFDGLSKPEYCAFDSIGERRFNFKGEYSTHMTGYDMVDYWQEVKTEINNL